MPNCSPPSSNRYCDHEPTSRCHIGAEASASFEPDSRPSGHCVADNVAAVPSAVARGAVVDDADTGADHGLIAIMASMVMFIQGCNSCWWRVTLLWGG
jgi:hypothetical protein